MRRAALACAAATVALAGCGGGAGDLLAIQVSGGFAPQQHVYVVTGDGRGSCDRHSLHDLPSARVIDAREIARDAADLAKHGVEYPSPAADARQYVLRTKDGDVHWGEGAPGLPAVLPRAQLLALQLQRLTC